MNDDGPVDPSHACDWMRDHVLDGIPAVDAFLLFSPRRWPVIDPSGPDPTEATETNLFSMAVLEQLRKDLDLTRDEYRIVGDAQKALHRERLLVRVGSPPAGSTAPPFEFDSDDWRNLFQLEAVAEFYANFRPPVVAGDYVDHNGDPWAGDAVPSEPGAPDAVDRTADFLDPEGDDATVVGTTVRFVGSEPLPYTRTGLNRDTIVLENDAVRPTKTYSIQSLTSGQNPDGTQWEGVTLYAAPTPGTTSWRINQRPIIVVIDPFGAREQKGVTLSGSGAVQINPADPTIIRLDGNPDLTKVNRKRTDGPTNAYPNANPPKDPSYQAGAFDTIYFASDAAPTLGGRPARKYRIKSVDLNNHTVEVEGGVPQFTNGVSAWHIPAGVSGQNVPLYYDLGPHAVTLANDAAPRDDTRGTDHYDGAAFVVFNGRIRHMTRISTYTSRLYPAGHGYLSSTRGNGRYYVRSIRGDSKFKNYCFTVEDFSFGARPARGERSRENYPAIGVRFARYYFGQTMGPAADDSVPPPAPGQHTNPTDPGTGKTGVLIHAGSTGPWSNSGSAGCFVSPIINTLRKAIVDIAADDFVASTPGAARPRYAQKLSDATQGASQTLWVNTNNAALPPADKLTAAEWDDRIFYTLWLIRPDERPL
jgi:hypothetical protein